VYQSDSLFALHDFIANIPIGSVSCNTMRDASTISSNADKWRIITSLGIFRRMETMSMENQCNTKANRAIKPK